MFPSAEIIGTDLSPIQPAFVPPNVHFQIDDMLLDWTWEEDYFDFVHFRALYGMCCTCNLTSLGVIGYLVQVKKKKSSFR